MPKSKPSIRVHHCMPQEPHPDSLFISQRTNDRRTHSFGPQTSRKERPNMARPNGPWGANKCFYTGCSGFCLGFWVDIGSKNSSKHYQCVWRVETCGKLLCLLDGLMVSGTLCVLQTASCNLYLRGHGVVIYLVSSSTCGCRNNSMGK